MSGKRSVYTESEIIFLRKLRLGLRTAGFQYPFYSLKDENSSFDGIKHIKSHYISF